MLEKRLKTNKVTFKILTRSKLSIKLVMNLQVSWLVSELLVGRALLLSRKSSFHEYSINGDQPISVSFSSSQDTKRTFQMICKIPRNKNCSGANGWPTLSLFAAPLLTDYCDEVDSNNTAPFTLILLHGEGAEIQSRSFVHCCWSL